MLGEHWARVPIVDDDIERVAKQLGLDPDFLLEVRAEAKIRDAEAGIPRLGVTHHQAIFSGAQHKRTYQFRMPMPPEPWKAWKEECERRGVEGAALLRSLIHWYLLGSHEPEPVTIGWIWNGKKHPRSDEDEKKRAERAVIPRGARRALRRRAVARRTTEQALARALVLEVVDGKRAAVKLVSPKQMYDDETRYAVRLEPGTAR